MITKCDTCKDECDDDYVRCDCGLKIHYMCLYKAKVLLAIGQNQIHLNMQKKYYRHLILPSNVQNVYITYHQLLM